MVSSHAASELQRLLGDALVPFEVECSDDEDEAYDREKIELFRRVCGSH